MAAESAFDFSRVPMAAEDVVVRTIDAEDDDVWVDVLVTPSGRRAIWNWSPSFESFEEAHRWLKTT
jgi:hypothetical protein